LGIYFGMDPLAEIDIPNIIETVQLCEPKERGSSDYILDVLSNVCYKNMVGFNALVKEWAVPRLSIMVIYYSL